MRGVFVMLKVVAPELLMMLGSNKPIESATGELAGVL